MEIREKIISRQNPLVKKVCALSDKKGRREQGLFRFDGIKLLREAVRNRLEMPLLLLRESCAETVGAALQESDGMPLSACADRVLTLADGVFDKISEEKSPEGVICVAKYIDKIHNINKIYKSRQQ